VGSNPSVSPGGTSPVMGGNGDDHGRVSTGSADWDRHSRPTHAELPHRMDTSGDETTRAGQHNYRPGFRREPEWYENTNTLTVAEARNGRRSLAPQIRFPQMHWAVRSYAELVRRRAPRAARSMRGQIGQTGHRRTGGLTSATMAVDAAAACTDSDRATPVSAESSPAGVVGDGCSCS
jgi:hypothetical protein